MGLLARWISTGDPWHRTPSRIPFWLYGPGSTRAFSWYLDGESIVQIKSLKEIQAWLLRCHYLSDQELFNEADFWQHPRTFEYLRKGDCEDYALWAWRKLLDLGLRAEFVVGSFANSRDHGHAWVVFEQDGRRFLLESTAKKKREMVVPLDEAKPLYIPAFGVDGDLQTCSYDGFCHIDTYRRDKRRKERRSGVVDVA